MTSDNELLKAEQRHILADEVWPDVRRRFGLDEFAPPPQSEDQLRDYLEKAQELDERLGKSFAVGSPFHHTLAILRTIEALDADVHAEDK